MEFGALYHAPKVLDLDSHTQGFHTKICSVVPKAERVLCVRNTQWKGLDEGRSRATWGAGGEGAETFALPVPTIGETATGHRYHCGKGPRLGLEP